MLPTVAVQIEPSAPLPALEQQLLRACSAGLERARCVSARDSSSEPPQGIAVVAWNDAGHASIEVGLGNDADARWITRDIQFAPGDPEVERWRAVGFTIALLADDPRFWGPAASAPPDAAESAGEAPPALGALRGQVGVELRALTGSGVVAGPWRWGGELRLSLPVSARFFATGSASYALASEGALDVRWFDATLGLGLDAGTLFSGLGARLRAELLVENVAASVERGPVTDRAAAWVPGLAVGVDLYVPIDTTWRLSARADAFWLDGSTAVASAGQRLGASAGAGIWLGVGAGYRF